VRRINGLRTKINKRNLKYGTFGRQRLPKVIRLALGEYRATTVEGETIYATMQPPPPAAASTGADGIGSASGEVEAKVKSSAKESIGVIVWCVVWFDRCDGTVLMLKGSSTLSFYTS
jgi:hypothetical protein